jgi:hypothetical protein
VVLKDVVGQGGHDVQLLAGADGVDHVIAAFRDEARGIYVYSPDQHGRGAVVILLHTVGKAAAGV